MKRILKALAGLIPRRRRLMWRYVSPRRHRIGAMVLVVLLGMIAVYSTVTSDARVRRRARRMLREVTRCNVEIESARFNLFGGVRLKGVKIWVPGDVSKRPILTAKDIFLRHEPWRLFTEGTLEPTEILCSGAEVTISHHVRSEPAASMPGGGSNLGQMMEEVARYGRQNRIPDIRITGAVLRQLSYRDGVLFHEQKVQLALVGRQEGRSTYRITLGQRGAALLGNAVWDLASGACRMDLAGFDQVLPLEYKTLFDRYGVRWGDTRLEAWGDRKDLGGQLVLRNVAIDYPLAEGSLRVEGISGIIALSKAGETQKPIVLRDIRGRLVDLAGAGVGISGTIEGAKTDSPFDIRLTVTGLQAHRVKRGAPHLPSPGTVAFIHEQYVPEAGQVDAEIHLFRQAGGPVRMEGKATLDHVTMTYKYFKYRLENLCGQIHFTQERAWFGEGVTCTAGPARIRMTRGQVRSFARWDDYSFTFQADEVPLDRKLMQALPEGTQQIWPILSPRGFGSAVIDVDRHPGMKQDDIAVTLKLDGRAGLTYREFPYPVDALQGTVRIRNDSVEINRNDPVLGRRGPMHLVVYGALSDLSDRQPNVDLTVDATDMPLDESLVKAIPEPGRGVLRSLRAAGRVNALSGQFAQVKDKPLAYTVTADLADMNCRYESLPYPVTGMAGRLVITPDGVDIRNLQGVHGTGTVGVNGKVFWLDRKLQADLVIRGRDVPLDGELAAALPADARKTWALFSPAGRSDIRIDLKYGKPEAPDALDYRVDIHPRGGATVCYKEFPYPFENLRGHVIVTPRRVLFQDLTASRDRMKATLNWSLETAGGQTEGGRSNEHAGGVPLPMLVVENLPIDGALLAALPRELSALVRRMGKEGTLGVVLNDMHVVGRPRKEAPPGGEGASEWAWAVAGKIALDGASIELGMDSKKMHGTISGAASGGPRGVGVDARIQLQSLAVGDRKITDIEGRVTKRPEVAAVTVSDFTGRIHGGDVVGSVDVRMGEDLVYEVRLEVNGVRLEELFAAGQKAATRPAEGGAQTRPGKTEEIAGLLQGRLEMVMTAGKPESRKASGEMVITRARIFKVPIPLELLHVVYLAMPGKGVFSEGRMSYRMQGDQLVFTEVAMSGTALSVLGSGTVDIGTGKMNMAFVTGPPRGALLPRIQEAGPLFRQFSRELMEVQVTGTLDNPQMRTVQLPGIDEMLRKLMNPEGKK